MIADEDNTGTLEFDEFQILVRGMNPKTMSAVSVLDTTIQSRLTSQQLLKAGAIVQNMQEAGYSDCEANAICRALFLDQTEEDMLPAWEVFDKERKGFLLAEEFRTVLPLLGEGVPEEEIDRLFMIADEDNSGSSHHEHQMA